MKVSTFHLIPRLRLSGHVTLDFRRCVHGVHTDNVTFYVLPSRGSQNKEGLLKKSFGRDLN